MGLGCRGSGFRVFTVVGFRVQGSRYGVVPSDSMIIYVC